MEVLGLLYLLVTVYPNNCISKHNHDFLLETAAGRLLHLESQKHAEFLSEDAADSPSNVTVPAAKDTMKRSGMSIV